MLWLLAGAGRILAVLGLACFIRGLVTFRTSVLAARGETIRAGHRGPGGSIMGGTMIGEERFLLGAQSAVDNGCVLKEVKRFDVR